VDTLRAFVSAFVAAALLAGCGGGMDSANTPPVGSSGSSGGGGVSAGTAPPAAVQQALNAQTPVDPAIVTADNNFGITLFQNLLSQALSQNPKANLAISPLSLSMALQVAYNGAGADAASGMAQTLQLGPLSVWQLNNDNAALQASLISTDPQVQITVANSLWIHLSGAMIAQSFIQTDQSYYGAEVGDLSGAPADVNAWASQQTQGVIPQILPPTFDNANLVALIANAIYFKGAWASAFDPSQTAVAAFSRSDSSQVMVPFMHQTEAVPYLQGANYQAVRLPYGQGHYSLLIVLPAAGVAFSSFAASFTPQSFAAIPSQMQPGDGTLSLPKFTASFSQDVASTLGSLGMSAALCPNLAFPALDNGCISSVQHATVVEVDETGTVAAAATVVGVTATAVPALPPPFTMTMDHPFLYAIRDDDDGELIFIGAMLDPSA
jgi:serine protease inhibitor